MVTDNRNPRTGNNALTIGFSAIAGLGFFAMMLALATGVIKGESANSSSIGLLFAAGALLFVAGLAAWLAVVRPWEHFDDINVPKYHGHHHDDDHAAEADH